MVTCSGPSGGAIPRMLLIFLHGLGDVGKSWQDFFPLASLPSGVVCVFPNAAKIPVTINGGMIMPAWYDIRSLTEPSELLNATSNVNSVFMSSNIARVAEKHDDVPGFERSATVLKELIDGLLEKYQLSYNNVVLGGFSQGGAVSLYMTLKYKLTLKGLLILSSYLPLSTHTFLKNLSGETNKIPVFWGHGLADPLIVHDWGRKSYQELMAKEPFFDARSSQFISYKGLQHSADYKEQQDVIQFLKRIAEAS